ncbi:MAG: hypothetical protein ACRCVX_01435 [Shewanella sp.]
MKISNSKKELARIISKNGGWREGAELAWFQGRNAGEVCREVWFGEHGAAPKFKAGVGFLSHHSKVIGRFTAGQFDNWHQTILSRAEYFHLYPAQDADGWIELDGTECPSGYFNKIIDAKLKDGRVLTDLHGRFEWDTDGPSSIIAYRMHKPEKVEPEFCESVMRSIPGPRYKPTIEQLMQTYKDRTHSVQLANEHLATCTKQANEVMEALSVACKAAGFDISPITAKQEPELAITDWRDLRVGDEVSVQHMKNVYSKSEVLVVGNSEVSIRNHAGVRKDVNLDDVDWEFIRRP